MPILLWLKSRPGRRIALPAASIFLAFVLVFPLSGLQSARAAALEGGRFVEADGWKAHITIDCLLKDKLCGTFRYDAQACEGDLIYTGETADGFEFRAELRSGRCLPGCTVQISGDFKRYAEVCKDSRHEGTLTAADQPPAPNTVAAPTTTPMASLDTPSPVVLVGTTVTTAKNEPARTVPAAPTPATRPQSAPATEKPTQRSERTADSTIKGVYSVDATTHAVTGQVRIDWDNGDSFEGTMVNGKRTGKGRFVWASGQSYEGDWRDDVADGEATIVFSNGDRYQGQVKDGIPDGRGSKQFANGDTYDGQFTKGVVDVEGTYTEKNGSRFTGQWKSGIKNGRGKFTWAAGQSYEGDWIADKPEGKGVFQFPNGDRYEGEMSNGLFQGKGRIIYAASQDSYEGGFAQGEAQGEGIYRWKNGDLYSGSWQKGKKAGMGRYTWTNGDYWEGEFADDKQTEAGRLYFTPTLVASGADVEKLAKQTNAVAGAQEATANKPPANSAIDKQLNRAKLLSIPMVAKELRDCSRKDAGDCATRIVNDVLNDTQFPHKWQTMATEKNAKGKGPVFEVDTNSVLEAGNVFSWLRSGDGVVARNIGIKYDCRGQSLEIQLIYNCSGSQAQSCALDPNLDKYAGKVIPATDIKNWFKGACER